MEEREIHMKHTSEEQIKKVETAFLKKITGYSYTEKRRIKEIQDGVETKIKEETHKKYIPPNEAMLLEWLKTHAPERWSGKPQTTDTSSVWGVVLLPPEKEDSDEHSMDTAKKTDTVS